MRKAKYDKYGFEVLEDEDPMDFTSTDNDDGDLNERDATPWWEDEDASYDDEYEEQEDDDSL